MNLLLTLQAVEKNDKFFFVVVIFSVSLSECLIDQKYEIFNMPSLSFKTEHFKVTTDTVRC